MLKVLLAYWSHTTCQQPSSCYPKRKLKNFASRKLKNGLIKLPLWRNSEITCLDSCSGRHAYIARTLRSKKEEISFVEPRFQKWQKNIQIHSLQRGLFLACLCDCEWWISEIIDISSELNENTMNSMLPYRPTARYRFPSTRQQHHQCSIPICDVLKIVGTPVSTGSTGRHHSLS